MDHIWINWKYFINLIQYRVIWYDSILDQIDETFKVNSNAVHTDVLSILKLENKNIFLASSCQADETLVQQILFNSFYSFSKGFFNGYSKLKYAEYVGDLFSQLKVNWLMSMSPGKMEWFLLMNKAPKVLMNFMKRRMIPNTLQNIQSMIALMAIVIFLPKRLMIEYC